MERTKQVPWYPEHEQRIVVDQPPACPGHGDPSAQPCPQPSAMSHQPKTAPSFKFVVTAIQHRTLEEKDFACWKPLAPLCPGQRVNNQPGLIVHRAALETIHLHICWGEDTADNRHEQGGLVLGLPWMDPEHRKPYAVAMVAIPASGAQGSPAFLRIPTQDWARMIAICETQYPSYEVVGWYHTHPGNLGIFMSGTDRNTQERIFHEDWHYAMVLNPQRREYGVFEGKYAKGGFGYVCKN